MAFPRKHLYNDEQIVLERQPHWWYLAPRAAGLVVACALAIWALVYDYRPGSNFEVPMRVLTGALVVVALVAFVVRFIGWRTTHFVVTTDRCIYRSGVLRKSGIEIPLERINTVLFSQTLFERILGAGDLSIESAGENSRQNFSDIAKPIEVQNTIYQQIEENENRKYDRIGAEAREAAEVSASRQNRSMTIAEQLHMLVELRDRGALTPEEFEAQKRDLLGG